MASSPQEKQAWIVVVGVVLGVSAFALVRYVRDRADALEDRGGAELEIPPLRVDEDAWSRSRAREAGSGAKESAPEDAGSEGAGGGAPSSARDAGEKSEPIRAEEGPIRVSGAASRSASPPEGGDGIGTLCVGVVERCPSLGKLRPRVIAGASVEGADTSGDSAEVAFEIDVPGGSLEPGVTYWVNGYLSESGAKCEGGPARGDPVTFSFFGSRPCPSFVHRTGEDVSGLKVDLNWSKP